MFNKKSLSILISYYDRPEQFKRGLNSICYQNFDRKKVELLILNDRSGKSVYNLVKKYSDNLNIRYFEIYGDSAKVRHGATRRNYLIKQSRGENIMLTDPEIVHYSNTIQQALDATKKYGSKIWYCGKVFATSSWADRKGESTSLKVAKQDVKNPLKYIGAYSGFNKKIDLEYFKKSKDYHQISPEKFTALMWCTVIPRNMLIKARGFNEDMKGWGQDDWDLFSRLSEIGVERIFDPQFIVYHLPHSWPMNIKKKKFFDKYNQKVVFENLNWGNLDGENVKEIKL